MAHISRQHWQLGLDICAGAIPSQQRLLRTGMAKVMHPRHASSLSTDLRGVKKRPDRVSESCAGIARSASSVVPKERAVRRDGDLSPAARRKILIDFARPSVESGMSRDLWNFESRISSVCSSGS